MHMFYEMVLTMQLVHLTCRKGLVQPPTRRMRLFQRTSDDNSRFTTIKFEAPRVRDTMMEERALESSRSISKDEDHHGYER